jgi:hypothetical protein
MKINVIRCQHNKKSYYWNGYWANNPMMMMGGCFQSLGAYTKLLDASAEHQLGHLKKIFPDYDLMIDCIEGDTARDLVLIKLGAQNLSQVFEI